MDEKTTAAPKLDLALCAQLIERWNEYMPQSVMEQLSAALSELDRLNAACRMEFESVQTLDAECSRLRVELDRLREDADRYQWLRHGDNDEIVLIPYKPCCDQHPEHSHYLPRGEKLDALIDDAARKEPKP